MEGDCTHTPEDWKIRALNESEGRLFMAAKVKFTSKRDHITAAA